MKETVSISTTNSIAERNFGMLDRFIKEKPNANMITYVSIIINRTNKIPEWRKKLIPEKRSLMMKWARESFSKQYQDFKQRRMEIRKAKNEKRLNYMKKKIGLKNFAKKRLTNCSKNNNSLLQRRKNLMKI